MFYPTPKIVRIINITRHVHDEYWALLRCCCFSDKLCNRIQHYRVKTFQLRQSYIPSVSAPNERCTIKLTNQLFSPNEWILLLHFVRLFIDIFKNIFMWIPHGWILKCHAQRTLDLLSGNLVSSRLSYMNATFRALFTH